MLAEFDGRPVITPEGVRTLLKSILGRLTNNSGTRPDSAAFGQWDGSWESSDQSPRRGAQRHRGVEYR